MAMAGVVPVILWVIKVVAFIYCRRRCCCCCFLIGGARRRYYYYYYYGYWRATLLCHSFIFHAYFALRLSSSSQCFWFCFCCFCILIFIFFPGNVEVLITLKHSNTRTPLLFYCYNLLLFIVIVIVALKWMRKSVCWCFWVNISVFISTLLVIRIFAINFTVSAKVIEIILIGRVLSGEFT